MCKRIEAVAQSSRSPRGRSPQGTIRDERHPLGAKVAAPQRSPLEKEAGHSLGRGHYIGGSLRVWEAAILQL